MFYTVTSQTLSNAISGIDILSLNIWCTIRPGQHLAALTRAATDGLSWRSGSYKMIVVFSLNPSGFGEGGTFNGVVYPNRSVAKAALLATNVAPIIVSASTSSFSSLLSDFRFGAYHYLF